MKSVVIVLSALALTQAAAASPCGDRIAKLQAQAAAKTSAADTTSTAGAGVETDSAKLHHQPSAAAAPQTGADVSGAANSDVALRNAKFQNDLFLAQAANDSGDAAACESAVGKAEQELPR